MGIRQDEAAKKYQPVLDLIKKEDLNPLKACEKLGVNYAAFNSWNRRQVQVAKVDGRTREAKRLKQQKAGGDVVVPKTRVRRQKTEPEMVTFQVPQKKGFMVCLVGDSEEIAKTLETISKLGVQ